MRITSWIAVFAVAVSLLFVPNGAEAQSVKQATATPTIDLRPFLSPSTVQLKVGDTVIIVASLRNLSSTGVQFGNALYNLAVFEGSVEQSQASPVLSPARPSAIGPSAPNDVAFVFTAVRAGVVTFKLSGSGEFSFPDNTFQPGSFRATSVSVTVTDSNQPQLGGRNFTLTSGPVVTDSNAQSWYAMATWEPGNAQLGYWPVRLRAAGLAILGLFPAGTTNHPLPVDTGLACYGLLDLAGSPPSVAGNTDLLCINRTRSTGEGTPISFSLALNQSSTASLSWAAPVDTSVGNYFVLPLGQAPISIGSDATSLVVPLNGATCFELFVAHAGQIVGNSDTLCWDPGISNLGD